MTTFIFFIPKYQDAPTILWSVMLMLTVSLEMTWKAVGAVTDFWEMVVWDSVKVRALLSLIKISEREVMQILMSVLPETIPVTKMLLVSIPLEATLAIASRDSLGMVPIAVSQCT